MSMSIHLINLIDNYLRLTLRDLLTSVRRLVNRPPLESSLTGQRSGSPTSVSYIMDITACP